jgi:PAS domain S-box-containing protein
VNTQTEKLFGYSRSELLNKPIETLIPERFRGRHRGRRAGFMSNAQLRPMGAGLELQGLRKDGSEFPVEISLSSVQTAGGLLVSAVVRDITDRKRTQELFRGLLDSAPDAMVVVSSDARIVLVNSQTEHLFGYHRDELLGRPVEVLIPERFWSITFTAPRIAPIRSFAPWALVWSFTECARTARNSCWKSVSARRRPRMAC